MRYEIPPDLVERIKRHLESKGYDARMIAATTRLNRAQWALFWTFNELAQLKSEPLVHRDSQRDRVEYQGTFYPVSEAWAAAFEALIAARGRPIGLTPYLHHTKTALDALERTAPELRALIRKADAKKGYFLSVFSDDGAK